MLIPKKGILGQNKMFSSFFNYEEARGKRFSPAVSLLLSYFCGLATTVKYNETCRGGNHEF